MNAVDISIAISAGSLVVSVLTSAFISGYRAGKANQTLITISERLARIEGMFELRLKE